MILKQNQTQKVKQLIKKIYSDKLSPDLLVELSPIICEILNIHYFGAMMLPNRINPTPLLVSNNPSDFVEFYAEFVNQDFIMNHLVKTHSPTVFRRMIPEKIPDYAKEYVHESNKVRPASDACYIPMKINNQLAGVFGVARAGLKNDLLTNNDIEIFDFICSILSEGFKRGLYLETGKADTAYLNGSSEVIIAGDRIRNAFKELFGEKWIEKPCEGTSINSRLLKDHIIKFKTISKQGLTGDIWLQRNGKKRHLMFSRIEQPYYRRYVIDEPQIKITLLKENDIPLAKSLLDYDYQKQKYGFTNRETEIISYIYQGYTNREIADFLVISESTVKLHIWNIFNKCGVGSRTQLVFTLSS